MWHCHCSEYPCLKYNLAINTTLFNFFTQSPQVIPFLAYPDVDVIKEALALLKALLICTSKKVLDGLRPLLKNDQLMECFTFTTYKRKEQAAVQYRAW